MGITYDHSHIQGWGADLDPKNRPAVPKERTPPRDIGVHWDQPEQQTQTVRILKSTERPRITRVFGSTVPPSGLSGWIREYAFKHSENDLRHWLLLLFADRVNMVEGIFSDLRKGRLPNPVAEMGLKAEWKYNRSATLRKMAIGAVILGAGFYFLACRKKD